MAVILHAAALAVAAGYALENSAATAVLAYVAGVSAAVALAYTSRPFGIAWCSRLDWKWAFAGVAPGALLLFAPGLEHGIVLLLGSALVVRLVRGVFYRHWGSITAPAVPLTTLLVEGLTLSYMQKVPFQLWSIS